MVWLIPCVGLEIRPTFCMSWCNVQRLQHF
jgi:hypothetical protein